MFYDSKEQLHEKKRSDFISRLLVTRGTELSRRKKIESDRFLRLSLCSRRAPLNFTHCCDETDEVEVWSQDGGVRFREGSSSSPSERLSSHLEVSFHTFPFWFYFSF